jgi:hypothetical protein
VDGRDDRPGLGVARRVGLPEERRQRDRRKDREDEHHHQQLDEREAGLMAVRVASVHDPAIGDRARPPERRSARWTDGAFAVRRRTA